MVIAWVKREILLITYVLIDEPIIKLNYLFSRIYNSNGQHASALW